LLWTADFSEDRLRRFRAMHYLSLEVPPVKVSDAL
jgi:hypothetical protein